MIIPVPPQKPIISTEPQHKKVFEEGGLLRIMCIVKSGENAYSAQVHWIRFSGVVVGLGGV